MERNGAPWNQKNGAGMWKRKHRSHDTGFGFRPQPSIHNPDPNPNPSHSSVSPDPSQFAPTVHQFLAHRDAFRFLWGQLDDALTARERLVLMKEEEIRRKEQALCDHEGLIEALKKEVVHWKAEASHYKNQFLSLKSQAEHQIRGNAESRGDCSLVRENDESQLCNRQENASANPCTYQKEENACLFKSSRVDEHLTAGDGIDEDCCLPSLQSVEICHSSNISAIKCFDRSTADAAGASPCTTAHSLPFSGYLTCSIEDMTGSCPAAESQAGNCIGSGQIPEPSLVTSPVNGDMTVNGNGRVVDAPVSNFPVKVKIEQIEDAPMVTFHDELDSSENIIPQMKLDDSLVNKERNVNSNSHMLDTALSILPVKVKTEPIESHAIVPVCNGLDSSVTQDLPVSIKNENPDDFMDELDHISLHERTKMLLQSKLSPRSISSELGECAGRTLPPEHESSELLNHKARDLKIQSRKKRTPTSSVEVALEEDAPGLLQILLERGLQLDEIKLYGNMENEDGHETLPDADGFAELETVISKLFSRPAMILKLAKVFHNKGSKASYCLACLISLIEQTRYLQLHKWSVEWGWCRDLLSFIFVFERHNSSGAS
ncbi:uncharacterized protein LOC116262539 isoform X2 [Nymphaea colorata]|uniref:uncharacterized protein LOC116262539 isoform X2 n=1 Tax=Nymphaea colorata TaxID=210225 RepID=UPI00129E6017|nr:uncharacterized protein LOC116262539 isoform X2 [Nymphaea colorata]